MLIMTVPPAPLMDPYNVILSLHRLLRDESGINVGQFGFELISLLRDDGRGVGEQLQVHLVGHGLGDRKLLKEADVLLGSRAFGVHFLHHLGGNILDGSVGRGGDGQLASGVNGVSDGDGLVLGLKVVDLDGRIERLEKRLVSEWVGSLVDELREWDHGRCVDV